MIATIRDVAPSAESIFRFRAASTAMRALTIRLMASMFVANNMADRSIDAAARGSTSKPRIVSRRSLNRSTSAPSRVVSSACTSRSGATTSAGTVSTICWATRVRSSDVVAIGIELFEIVSRF